MAKDYMEVNTNDSSRIWLAQATVAVSVVLFGLKYWAYYLTNSQVVLSDALETIVNILASVIALWVVHWASKPADADHPYGHGKAELLSAYFEGGLIFSAALFILVQAVMSFAKPPELSSLGIGLYITIAAALINGFLGWLLIVRGKALRSSALTASGYHLLSDLVTSVGSVLGLSLVMLTNIVIIDSIAAVMVALYLGYTGFKVMRSAVGGLLDKIDTDALHKFNEIINTQRYDGIIQIHHVRMLISGDYFHVDAHIVVPEFWDIQKAHSETENYESHLFSSLKVHGEAHFHIDPCERKYCENCSYSPCLVREVPFKNYKNVSIKAMMSLDKHRK